MNELSNGWNPVSIKPTEYGKYEVYRSGCNKQHYETWNNTGWAYNNNDITHWRQIISPLASPSPDRMVKLSEVVKVLEERLSLFEQSQNISLFSITIDELHNCIDLIKSL